MLRFFNNLKISYKIMLVLGINSALFISYIIFYLLPQNESFMLLQKKLALKSMIDLSINVLENNKAKYDRGEVTFNQAKELSIEEINKLRYEDGLNYFWIQNLEPKMIMHPTKPNLDGKDISNIKDPNGVKLFVEFANICKKQGSGYVEYQWEKPNEKVPTDKISYVKYFEPFDWVVGTGTWTEIDHVLLNEVNNLYMISYVILIVLMIIGIVISNVIIKKISSRLQHVTELLTDVAVGDLSKF